MKILKILSPQLSKAATKAQNLILPSVFAIGLASTPLIGKAQTTQQDEFISTTQKTEQLDKKEKIDNNSQKKENLIIGLATLGTLLGVGTLMGVASKAADENIFDDFNSY